MNLLLNKTYKVSKKSLKAMNNPRVTKVAIDRPKNLKSSTSEKSCKVLNRLLIEACVRFQASKMKK